ncbi:N/A [soil metagenome]
MIETMAALAVTAILSGIALPSFQAQVHKARRADVLVSMMQVQMAQERWRSNNASYGTLADIGAARASGGGHYTIRLASSTSQGYEVTATAVGAQAGDAACRHMKLVATGANVSYASGPDASMANAAGANRVCWSL